jgi:hypothetical protein
MPGETLPVVAESFAKWRARSRTSALRCRLILLLHPQSHLSMRRNLSGPPHIRRSVKSSYSRPLIRGKRGSPSIARCASRSELLVCRSIRASRDATSSRVAPQTHGLSDQLGIRGIRRDALFGHVKPVHRRADQRHALCQPREMPAPAASPISGERPEGLQSLVLHEIVCLIWPRFPPFCPRILEGQREHFKPPHSPPRSAPLGLGKGPRRSRASRKQDGEDVGQFLPAHPAARLPGGQTHGKWMSRPVTPKSKNNVTTEKMTQSSKLFSGDLLTSRRSTSCLLSAEGVPLADPSPTTPKPFARVRQALQLQSGLFRHFSRTRSQQFRVYLTKLGKCVYRLYRPRNLRGSRRRSPRNENHGP